MSRLHSESDYGLCGWMGVYAHPDAPAGGAGPGPSRSMRMLGFDSGLPEAGSPHARSPAGRLANGPGAPGANQPPSIKITFGRNANRSIVSEYTLEVLQDILRAAGESAALITSTARTPQDQARAMYDNLESAGVEKQKKLYGAAGDKVIEVYVAGKKAKKSKDAIQAEMVAKIEELGPSKVSKHIADATSLGVIDIAPSSIHAKTKFISAVESDLRITKFLKPPNDPAYHLEIPQKTKAALKQETPAPSPGDSKPREQKKTWVEFKVVDDQTGKPVSNVRLRVTTPDGIENFYTTNSNGLIRIEEIDTGTCDIGEVLDNDALEVVAVA